MTLIMVLLFVISGLEIFFNLMTKLVLGVVRKVNRSYTFSEKGDTLFKLIWVIGFFIATVYFLSAFVKGLAHWMGIPLDMRLMDIFK